MGRVKMTRVKKITAIVSAILLLGTIIYQVSAYEGDDVGAGEPVVAVDGDVEGVDVGGTYLPEDVEDSEEITLGYFEDDDVDGITLGEINDVNGEGGEGGYMGFVPAIDIPPPVGLLFFDNTSGLHMGDQMFVPPVGTPPVLSISIEDYMPEGWLFSHWFVDYSILRPVLNDPAGLEFVINESYSTLLEGYILQHIMPDKFDFITLCQEAVCAPPPHGDCLHDAWLTLPTFRVFLNPMVDPTLTKDVIYVNGEAYDGQFVYEGDIITYRLRVNNPNPRGWKNFRVVDVLPDGLTLVGDVQVTPAGALVDDDSTGAGVYVVIDLPAGPPVGPGNVDIIFTARVDDVTLAEDGYFVNVATLCGPPLVEGGNRRPVDDCDAEVPARPPGVSLEKFVSSREVDPGGNLTYRLVVRNTGGAVLTDVVVRDDLPVQLTQPRNLVITPENAGTGNFVGQLLTVNIPRLGINEEVIITFDVTVAADVAPGSPIDNVAEVTTGQNVSDRDNERVTVNVPGQYRPPGISLDKSVSSGTVRAGGNLTYTIVVRNLGDVVLTNVEVRDDLPAQLTNPRNLAINPANAGTGSFVGQVLTVIIPELGIDQVVTITFDVTVAQGVANNTVIRNVASVTTDQGPSAQDDARVTVGVPGQPGQVPLTGDVEITGAVLFMFIVGGTMLVMMSLIKAEKRKLRRK